MSILDQTKEKMVQAIEHLKNDLKNIRTGRANPSMLDNVQVEVYGSIMRLRDIASVTVPEPRQLLITPFDPRNTPAIGKSIEKANLGFMPIVEANCVRMKIPPMDARMREEMIKLTHEKREKCKVGIREARKKGNEMVRKQKNAGEISEDQMKKEEKNIQDLTDKFCAEADEIAERKEKEVSTI